MSNLKEKDENEKGQRLSRDEVQNNHIRDVFFEMSPDGAIVLCNADATNEDDDSTVYSAFDEEEVDREWVYDDEIEISPHTLEHRMHSRQEDGEYYSKYEAKLKPIVKRGTFEQFLAVYVPKKADDEFYFMIACECGRLDMAQHIYESVDDLEINGHNNEENPLCFAIHRCHTRVVRWLLTLDGIDVNIFCEFDYPALGYATNLRFPSDIIMRMVDLGASLDIDYDDDNNPLHIALEENRLDLVMYFLMHGSDPCARMDYNDGTAFNCDMTPEAMSVLLNHRSIFLGYCLHMSGSNIAAEDFAMLADMTRMDQPEDEE